MLSWRGILFDPGAVCTGWHNSHRKLTEPRLSDYNWDYLCLRLDTNQVFTVLLMLDLFDVPSIQLSDGRSIKWYSCINLSSGNCNLRRNHGKEILHTNLFRAYVSRAVVEGRVEGKLFSLTFVPWKQSCSSNLLFGNH